MIDRLPSRRQFLQALAALALPGLTPRRLFGNPAANVVHPEPRPGIDASKVLTADQLINPSAAEVYDMIREIPEVADGILCHCGCAELDGYYSLLTCYEEGGMAQFCEICQGEGRMTYRRHQEGQTLDQIRNAIDARLSA